MNHPFNQPAGLKQFRTTSFTCAGISLLCVVGVSQITAVPAARVLLMRTGIVALVITLYFLVIGFRAQMMIRNHLHQRPQTFQRPAPEWLLGLFVMAAIAANL